MRILLTGISLVFIAMSSTAHAAFQGSIGGRSADISEQSRFSIDYGINQSDEASYIGGRFNFKPVDRLLLYIDYGSLDFDGETPNGFGGISKVRTNDYVFSFGGYYEFAKSNQLTRFPVALRLGYQGGDTDGTVGTNNARFESKVFSSELLMSGQASRSGSLSNLNWYASLGYIRIESSTRFNIEILDVQIPQSDSTKKNEITLAAGLVLPVDKVDFYIGVERIEEFYYGLGFRINF